MTVLIFELCFVCVTAYVLMRSVFRIRKFYKENKLTEELNSKAMVNHVFAFGGFTLGLISCYPFLLLFFLET